jgi:3-oxoacyl-[acyl-carrier protein] reductase
MPLSIDLSNRTALITGATGQLGHVMARTLAQCGANVALHYRSSRDAAEKVKKDVESFGVRAAVVHGDVTDAASMTKLRDEVVAALGWPDIVVANAVTQIFPWATVLEESLEDYESQFRSCVMQNVLLAKLFVPEMIKKGRGRYIAINTECSMQMFQTQSAYVAGKRGMDGMLRVLAKEVGQHAITVNQVAPGWTISDTDRANGTEKRQGYDENVPLRRRGTDQEIANVVAFVASDLASFITGAYIPVCGGNVMPTI